MYARASLSDADRAEVTRAQRTKITDWEVGKLRALIVSTASGQDRAEIQMAIDYQNGMKA